MRPTLTSRRAGQARRAACVDYVEEKFRVAWLFEVCVCEDVSERCRSPKSDSGPGLGASRGPWTVGRGSWAGRARESGSGQARPGLRSAMLIPAHLHSSLQHQNFARSSSPRSPANLTLTQSSFPPPAFWQSTSINPKSRVHRRLDSKSTVFANSSHPLISSTR